MSKECHQKNVMSKNVMTKNVMKKDVMTKNVMTKKNRSENVIKKTNNVMSKNVMTKKCLDSYCKMSASYCHFGHHIVISGTKKRKSNHLSDRWVDPPI